MIFILNVTHTDVSFLVLFDEINAAAAAPPLLLW